MRLASWRMDSGMGRIGSLSHPKTLMAQSGQQQFILGDGLRWEAIGKGGRGTFTAGRGGEVQIEKKPSQPEKEQVNQKRLKLTMEYKPEKK